MNKVPILDLVLPWPSRKMSGNARLHWKALLGEKKRIRRETFYIAKEAGIEQLEGLSEMCLLAVCTYNAPDLRARDVINLLTPIKSTIDGVFDALDTDDSRIIRVIIEWGELDRPDGSMRLCLYELSCSEDKRGKY